MGTMCKPVLDFLKKEKAHKGVVFVLNKVDLVPTWVTVSCSSAFFSVFLSFRFSPSSPSLSSPHFSSQGLSRATPRETCIIQRLGLLQKWNIKPPSHLFPIHLRPVLGSRGLKSPISVLEVG